jgi:CheY-like chemotaxis protein
MPQPGPYVMVYVADTGTGMSPEVLARAFDPFFTTKTSGSGLGLSQTFGLARQSGGIARIVSVPGQGTRVEVLLPGLDAEMSPAVEVPLAKAPPPAASILIVDDNRDVRETTALLLQRLGYATTVAADGSEALDILRRAPGIDLLLTDVSMPVMTGPQLAREARVLRPDLPILMFSGFVDPDGLAEAPPDCRLLRKPIRSRELAAAIDAALQGKEVR